MCETDGIINIHNYSVMPHNPGNRATVHRSRTFVWARTHAGNTIRSTSGMSANSCIRRMDSGVFYMAYFLVINRKYSTARALQEEAR